jgi:hypothetical protein
MLPTAVNEELGVNQNGIIKGNISINLSENGINSRRKIFFGAGEQLTRIEREK